MHVLTTERIFRPLCWLLVWVASFLWLAYWYPRHGLYVPANIMPRLTLQACANQSGWGACFFGGNGYWRPLQYLLVIQDEYASWMQVIHLVVWPINIILIYLWSAKWLRTATERMWMAWLWSMSSPAIWMMGGGLGTVLDLGFALSLGGVVALRYFGKSKWAALIVLTCSLVVLGLSDTERMILIGIWWLEALSEEGKSKNKFAFVTLLTAISLCIGLREVHTMTAVKLSSWHWLAMASLPASPMGVMLLPLVLVSQGKVRLAILFGVVAALTSGEYLTDPGHSDLLMFGAARTLVLVAGLFLVFLLIWHRYRHLRWMIFFALGNIFVVIVLPRLLQADIADASPRSFPLVTLAIVALVAKSMPTGQRNPLQRLAEYAVVSMLVWQLLMQSSLQLDALAKTPFMAPQASEEAICVFAKISNLPDENWFRWWGFDKKQQACSEVYFFVREVPPYTQTFWDQVTRNVFYYRHLIVPLERTQTMLKTKEVVWRPPLEFPDWIGWQDWSRNWEKRMISFQRIRELTPVYP